MRQPKKSFTSIRNSTASSHTNSDTELLIKYIQKLSEVVEENKLLEGKLKEQEMLILAMKNFPEKFVKNFYCSKCEKFAFENEDLLALRMKKRKQMTQLEIELRIKREENLKSLVKQLNESFSYIGKSPDLVLVRNEGKIKLRIDINIIQVPDSKTFIPSVPSIPSVPISISVPLIPSSNTIAF